MKQLILVDYKKIAYIYLTHTQTDAEPFFR